MLGRISDIFDDVIVMEFPGSKAAEVQRGCDGFPRHDVMSTTCDNDSEADDENEAGGNCE